MEGKFTLIFFVGAVLTDLSKLSAYGLVVIAFVAYTPIYKIANSAFK